MTSTKAKEFMRELEESGYGEREIDQEVVKSLNDKYESLVKDMSQEELAWFQAGLMLFALNKETDEQTASYDLIDGCK